MRRRPRVLLLLVGLGGCGPAPGTEPEEPVHLTETVVVPAPRRAEAATLGETFAPGQRWRGTYVCAQGETNLELVVDEVVGMRVRAVFEFAHEESGARGSFFVDGLVEARTGRVRFSPRQWIVRPSNYMTVGMDGTVSPDGATLTGRITNETCGRFELELVRQR